MEQTTQKKPRQREMTEWRTGNTGDAPSESAGHPQGIRGETDAPRHLGQRLRSQQKQK